LPPVLSSLALLRAVLLVPSGTNGPDATVPIGTMSSRSLTRGPRRRATGGVARATSARERIVAAACAAFTERGFAAASTREIATRAQVSKRELYSLFGTKQQLLIACIAERASRMRLPAARQAPRNRRELRAVLVQFGAVLLRELSATDVVALYRLAVCEAARAPEVAQALDIHVRQAARAALREVLETARSASMLDSAGIEAVVNRFMAALLDDVLMRLALGVRTRPGEREIARRASAAAGTVFAAVRDRPDGR
jgi:AcrR family transcriptional regulator